jgi:hypothetical protein
MTATLDDVTKKIKPEPTAEQLAAEELVRRAREQGLSLTGPDGLLKQLTKTVLETSGSPACSPRRTRPAPSTRSWSASKARPDHAAVQAATARIEDATGKMAGYRAALDAGGDPEEIGKWIAEAKAQRLAAEAQLRQATSGAGTTLTRQQIKAVIEECADIARDLRDADPTDTASAYRKLGLRLTYHPGRNLVQATAYPRAANIGKWFVSEGGLERSGHGMPADAPEGIRAPLTWFNGWQYAGPHASADT